MSVQLTPALSCSMPSRAPVGDRYWATTSRRSDLPGAAHGCTEIRPARLSPYCLVGCLSRKPAARCAARQVPNVPLPPGTADAAAAAGEGAALAATAVAAGLANSATAAAMPMLARQAWVLSMFPPE